MGNACLSVSKLYYILEKVAQSPFVSSNAVWIHNVSWTETTDCNFLPWQPSLNDSFRVLLDSLSMLLLMPQRGLFYTSHFPCLSTFSSVSGSAHHQYGC